MKTESKVNILWRKYTERSFSLLVPVLAILAAFLVSGVLILAWGANPIEAYVSLFSGAFGSPNAIATTLERMTPLIFTGLAVIYGYRSGFFNIGAEGQLYMGAIAAVWVAVTFPGWPAWLLLPACVIASGLMGLVWILLPAFLKAKRGINEVLTTLLLNYVAIQYHEWVIRVDHIQEGITLFGGEKPVWTWLNYFTLKDPTQPYPKSPFLVDASFMPSLKSILESNLVTGLLGNTSWYQEVIKIPALGRMTLAPVLAILAVVLIYFVMFKTVTGFRARSVGANPEAAKFIGVHVPRTIFISALISGTLAGLAGGMEVLGTQHRIIPSFLVNAGFDGIPVALIGQLHPFGGLLSAIFFGALRAGSNKMQVITSVPVAVVYIIQALAIMFAIAGTTVNIQAIIKKRRMSKGINQKNAAKVAEGETYAG